MPFLTTDVTGEHDGLAVFAQQQTHQVATTLQGLSREQLATRPTVSEFSLGTLARHVLAVTVGFAAEIRQAAGSGDAEDGAESEGEGEGGDEAEGDASRADASAALTGDDSGELRPTDTAGTLIEELEAAGAELGAAIRAADLDAPVPVPEAPWFSGEERWTVRWVALHCLEEVARHAGHADLLRETLDGQFAYALNALADGEPWPPQNW
ncbi:mycothiol transferase [Brachybacterium sp. AOP43-C2-M15]|uniref:mycothiol transferase n=1 Tax=Brachybacterium sp. AOP43-C2-M15 TaxID=3457661 RepID=UPI0040349739